MLRKANERGGRQSPSPSYLTGSFVVGFCPALALPFKIAGICVLSSSQFCENVTSKAKTIKELAAFLGVNTSTPVTPEVVATAMPMPTHKGMDAKWFDLAVKRAFDAGLCIQRTARASVVAVSSATDADVSYLVSADSCQCRGHLAHGKCLHRAFYLFFKWVNECDAVAEAAHNRSIAA